MTNYIFVNVETHIDEGGKQVTECEKKSPTEAIVNNFAIFKRNFLE